MTHEDELPTSRIADLCLASIEHRWLIRNLLSSETVGFIGAHPKHGKTWLGLDFAVSTASASPCLGHFAVDDPGPALVYLAEDALPIVRERVAGIVAHRGLDLERLDLHVITAPSLRLDLEADQARLATTIDRLRPKLLLLDPLVRLHACDENSSMEIAGILGFLRDLQRRHHVAIVLVHHLGKKARGQLGQGLRGSGDLHAWGDDNAYLTKKDGDILLTLEHRSAPPGDPIRLRLVADSDGAHAHLEVVNLNASPGGSSPPAANRPPLAEQILDVLSRTGQPVRRTALREQLRVNNTKLGDTLTDLESRKLVSHTDRGWALPQPAQLTFLQPDQPR
ncbi:MAG: AAA family ATPase [Deltaproteobacteria bacterium]|nr:AAA family ATPase [Deltaproteobacteria bacterium]